MNKNLSCLEEHPLLKTFWNEYLFKAVDYVFKERNLAFVDIYYHNDIPAFVARDDDGNKYGIIIELELNCHPLNLCPNKSDIDSDDYDGYFIKGFSNLDYNLYSIVLKLYDNEFIEQLKDESNARKYIKCNPNYWMILEGDNSVEKLFISFPNFLEI